VLADHLGGIAERLSGGEMFDHLREHTIDELEQSLLRHVEGNKAHA
jgi:hypothetical protein